MQVKHDASVLPDFAAVVGVDVSDDGDDEDDDDDDDDDDDG